MYEVTTNHPHHITTYNYGMDISLSFSKFSKSKNISDGLIHISIVATNFYRCHYSFPQVSICQYPSIIVYFSGYLARSITRLTSCDDCEDYLVTSQQLEQIKMDSSFNYSAATFLN